MSKLPKGGRVAITRLTTTGGPCGEGSTVTVAQTGRNTATLTCDKCGAEVTVSMPGGRVDLVGMAALDDGVERLHRSEA